MTQTLTSSSGRDIVARLRRLVAATTQRPGRVAALLGALLVLALTAVLKADESPKLRVELTVKNAGKQPGMGDVQDSKRIVNCSAREGGHRPLSCFVIVEQISKHLELGSGCT